MDASFFAELEADEFDEVLNALDPRIGNVLRELEHRKVSEVNSEMVANFNIKEMAETRTTLFRIAMDRVDHCLSQVAKARDSDGLILDARDEGIVMKADKLFRRLDPSVMINRKCPKKLANDILELMMFDCGGRSDMPTGMLRTVPATSSGLSYGVTPDDIICLKRVAGIILADARDNGVCEDAEENVECVTGGFAADSKCDNTKARGENDECVTESKSETEPGLNDHSGDEQDSSEVEMSDLATTDIQNSANEDPNVGSILDNTGDSDNSIESENSDTEIMDSSPVSGEGQTVTNKEQGEEVENCVGTHENMEVNYNQNTTEPNECGENRTVMNESKNSENDVQNIEGELLPAVMIEGAAISPEVCGIRRSAPLLCTPGTGSSRSTTNENNVEKPHEKENNSARRETLQHAKYLSADHLRHSEPGTQHVGSPVRSSHSNRTEEHLADNSLIVKLLEVILGAVQHRPVRESSGDYRSGDMAGRREYEESEKKRARDDEERRRHNRNHDSRLHLLEEWRESYTRRTHETEDNIMERMRRLQMQNDEMAAEMRRMRRHIQDLAHARPVFMTPLHDNTAGRNPISTTIPSQTYPNEERAYTWRADGADAADDRPRAASFAGATARSKLQCCNPTTQQRPEESCKIVGEWKLDPKPQRSDQRRKEKRRNNPTAEKTSTPAESAISQWLSNAKKDSGVKEDTPRGPPRAVLVTSPSWADDDEQHGDLDSETLSPTTTGSEAAGVQTTPDAERRDGTKDPDNDDDYQFPPSGQVAGSSRQQLGATSGRKEQQRNNGGARPKTRGKNAESGGESKGVSQNNPAIEPRNGKKSGTKNTKGGVTFAKVVTRSGWKTVQTGKRKYDKVSPKAAFPLKGIKATVNRDIYMQGLSVGDSESEDDIIASVRAYCIDNGVTPVFIRIIPVRYDCTRTGCRLTVSEADFERVILDSFWPEDIRVREWTPRPRDNNGNGAGGEDQPSDNDE